VIKSDVEGADYSILKGMRGTIRKLKKKPMILCEIAWGQRSTPFGMKRLRYSNGSSKMDINTVTILGQKLWHSTINHG